MDRVLEPEVMDTLRDALIVQAMMRVAEFVLLFSLLFFSACAHESAAQVREQRSAELRAAYPPGKTTRFDVQARWGHPPERKLTRPSTGWTLPFVLDAEQRTGAFIVAAEKYMAPTATSAGFPTLEHVWFFYDRADEVVDVVWERMGD